MISRNFILNRLSPEYLALTCCVVIECSLRGLSAYRIMARRCDALNSDGKRTFVVFQAESDCAMIARQIAW